MRKHILLLLALCLHIAARGQTIITELELSGLFNTVSAQALYYWFDSDEANIQAADDLSGTYVLDVSQLSDGLHTLHYRVTGTDNIIYALSSEVFLKMTNSLAEPEGETPVAAAQVQYWFDSGVDNVQIQEGLSGSWVLDVSQLSDGLHTLHYQVTGTDDVIYALSSEVFLKMTNSLAEPEDETPVAAAQVQYWFDSDVDNTQIQEGLSGSYVLDVSQLSDGLHTLHYQVTGTDDVIYALSSEVFLKMTNSLAEPEDETPVAAAQVQYWFDSDVDNTQIQEGLSGSYVLDVSQLSDGLHTLHYQVTGTDGFVYAIASDVFLKMENSISEYVEAPAVAATQVQYWFDDDVDNMQIHKGLSGSYVLDVSQLSDGLHTLHYQVTGTDNIIYALSSEVFLKMANSLAEPYIETAMVAKKMKYWFDTDISSAVLTDVANSLQTIDVSALPSGLHTLYYQIVYEDGNVSPAATGIFLKNYVEAQAEGENSITKYQYWLNDNSTTLQTVTLDATVNPYTLIALLPMQKVPLSSGCFHFEVKDGMPMMYAKNDFHIRFHDAAGYFVDSDSRQFIDYSISQNVEPVQSLEGYMGTVSLNKPDSNDVVWYTIHAEPGDTVAFCSSQATTIQVFAPSGAEVFKTSESASVNWGGIHTWESGTYYLAVHDVTGSKEEMTLEYMHMDKYDVVDWDVHTVGNGGCSTITFKGNGFRDLYAVDLVIAPGDTIHSVDVSHDSDAETAVTFDFTNATLGDYNAVFHFTEEDKPVDNVVTVEEAVDIELATDVSFPSSFLRGTSTTYTIKIENKGNMTAYDVPLEIRLSSESFSNIESVIFKDIDGNDMDVFSLYFNEEDSTSAEDQQYFMNNVQSLSGLSTFIILRDTIRNVDVGFSDRLITIPPKHIFTIKVEVKCTSSINLYATIPSDWYSIYSAMESPMLKLKKGNSGKDYCCEKEKWECIVGNASDALGLIPVPLLGCIPALVDLGTFSTFEIMCANGKGTKDNIKNYFANYYNNKNGNRGSAWGKVAGVVLGCFGAKIIGVIGKLRSNLKSLNLNKKITLQQADNYAQIRNELIDEYDRMMRSADQYYKQGNITKAEEIEKEAQMLLNQADDYKMWADIKRYEASEIATEIKKVENQIEQEKENFDRIISYLKNGYNFLAGNLTCAKERLDAKNNCPPNPDGGGGTSTPAPPADPNDIYGYLSEAGSKFIADSVARVNYTIEFENDTTFATAAAHTIVIKDTLDKKVFDLTKFMPTSVRIGEREVFIDAADVVTGDGKTSFVRTIDMRPEINAIAQVEGEFNQKNGIAQWTFQSLDPMTMEPTDDLMQGILPVNYNGTAGIGEVMLEVGVKQGKADGTELSNRAGIVFDYEEAILTPTWTNIVDAVAPRSIVDGLTLLSDSTLRVFADGEDARSGVWKYEWYVRHGENAPWWKEGETYEDCFDFRFYKEMDYAFCVIATDSAGNVERKELQAERLFKTYGEEFEEAVSLGPIPASPVGDSRIYDLSGRRHDEPQEGINIVGRKKILFRRKGK